MIYQYILNGKIVPMTDEEIAAMEAATEQPTEPTTEERLANLEEALNMILNGVTE